MQGRLISFLRIRKHKTNFFTNTFLQFITSSFLELFFNSPLFHFSSYLRVLHNSYNLYFFGGAKSVSRSSKSYKANNLLWFVEEISQQLRKLKIIFFIFLRHSYWLKFSYWILSSFLIQIIFNVLTSYEEYVSWRIQRRLQRSCKISLKFLWNQPWNWIL